MSGARTPGLTVWSGWDLRGGVDADEGRRAFAESARGGEDRYELLAVAARGFRPPKFLTRTEVATDATSGDARSGEPDPAAASLRPTWSLVYRPVAPSPVVTEPPHAIYLLGVDPPVDAHEADLRIFEDFYVNVHVREVAARRGALRAVPHKLEEVVRAPHNGAPTFLTAYELDERSAAVRRHTGPPYAAGPDVWQRHSTPWRLWYLRLPTGG